MDTNEIKVIAGNLMKESESMLVNLHDRWMDEKEYEDFNDYEKVMREKVIKLQPLCNFIQSTKRPFGYIVVVDKYKLHLSVTTKEIKCDVNFVSPKK